MRNQQIVPGYQYSFAFTKFSYAETKYTVSVSGVLTILVFCPYGSWLNDSQGKDSWDSDKYWQVTSFNSDFCKVCLNDSNAKDASPQP